MKARKSTKNRAERSADIEETIRLYVERGAGGANAIPPAILREVFQRIERGASPIQAALSCGISACDWRVLVSASIGIRGGVAERVSFSMARATVQAEQKTLENKPETWLSKRSKKWADKPRGALINQLIAPTTTDQVAPPIDSANLADALLVLRDLKLIEITARGQESIVAPHATPLALSNPVSNSSESDDTNLDEFLAE